MTEINLNYQYAAALSGEFVAPSDPTIRRHTVARLYWASQLNGEIEDYSSSQVTYLPDWAPVEVRSSTGSQFGVSVYFPILDESDLEGLADDERVDLLLSRDFISVGEGLEDSGILRLFARYGNNRSTDNSDPQFFQVDDIPENAAASRVVAESFGSFFSQFEGWIKNEDGVWVPPSSEAQEPAVGSER